MAQAFSKRSIAAFVVGMVVATVLTVMGTYDVLHRFVLDNPHVTSLVVGGLSLDHFRANLVAANATKCSDSSE